MKNIMMISMLCGIVFVALPLAAETETIGNYTWTYRINGDTAEIYGTDKYSYSTVSYVPAVSPKPNGAIEIPSVLGGKTVTSIGYFAFRNCNGLTSVTIPDSVTNIWSSAFCNCSGLTNVTIGSGVISIGGQAFCGCSGLTSVTIPNSVTSIGYDAFRNCSGLTSVMIPDSMTSIGDCAFSGCSGLTSVTIPNGVTNIGARAFEYCSGLTSVTIGDGVMCIESCAFYGCRGLTSVTIPDNVTSIGDHAFSCKALSSVTIGKSVEEIGEFAFNDLYNAYNPPDQYNAPTNLTCVVICSTNLQELGNYVFPSFSGSYDEHGNVCEDVCQFTFVAPNDPFDILPTIRRCGASLTGWWTMSDGGERLETTADVVPGQTYYAHWSKVHIASIELAIPDTVTVWDEDWQKITVDGYNVVQPDFISAVYDEYGNLIDAWKDYCTIAIYSSWDLESPFQFDAYSGLRELPSGDWIVKVSDGVAYCTGEATVSLTVQKRYDVWDSWDFNSWWISIDDFSCTPNTSSYPDSGHDGSVIDLGVYGQSHDASVYLDSSCQYYSGTTASFCADFTMYRAGVGDEWTKSEGLWVDSNYGYSSSAVMPIRYAGDYQLSVSVGGYIEEDNEYYYYRNNMYGQQSTFYIRLSPANFTNQTITAENAQCVFTGEGICPTNNGFRVSLSDPTTYYMENVTFTNAGVHAVKIGAATTEYDMTCSVPDEELAWTEYAHYVTDYDDYWGWGSEHLVFNYTGVVEVAYTVLPRPVVAEQARVVPTELHCDGAPQTCSVVVTNDYTGAVLVEGTDYDVTYSNNILAGMATATVICKGNYTGTFSHKFEILPSTNVVEVLGLDKAWNTGGNAEWFAEWYDNAHDGVSCMRSGAIGDGQESWIETVVTNTGVVSFWWKASSEAYRGIAYDKLIFTVDGVIPESVPPIGGEVDWTNVTYAVEGDGPHVLRWTYRKDESDNDGEDCAWLDDVQYLREVHVTFADGGATGGNAPDALVVGEGTEITLPDQASLVRPKHRFVGWRINDETLATGTVYKLGYDDVTFTAAWEEKRVLAPSVEVAEWYDTERTTVRMNCDTVGAAIHYTLDGSTPTAESSIYAGTFNIAGTVTIKAIAVLDDWFDSDVVSAESVRAPWTPDECLNAAGMAFQMGGTAEWKRDRTVTHDGDTAMQSGEIGDGQTSWIETTVVGTGTLTFWWKASSEAYKGTIYDCARFTVDGIAAVPDIGGEIDWRCETVTITGAGTHTIRWAYIKDSQDANGSDCAWLDCVTWTPSDPLPALNGTDADSDAAAIVAGLSDGRLSEKVVGTAAYTAFRNWVDGKGLSHAVVRDAPNAWLSYALDAPGLMAKATPLASEDVSVETFTPSSESAGAFDLVVDIAGEEIGEGAQLAEVLGVEGSAELNESAFSSEGLAFAMHRTADGKVKATVTPVGSPPAFFLRVKVK